MLLGSRLPWRSGHHETALPRPDPRPLGHLGSGSRREELLLLLPGAVVAQRWMGGRAGKWHFWVNSFQHYHKSSLTTFTIRSFYEDTVSAF